MYCVVCGKSVLSASRFCSSCGASIGTTLQVIEPEANLSIEWDTIPRPWIRYWARMLDICLFSVPAGVFVTLLFPAAFSSPAGEQLMGMFGLFAWIFVEALLLSAFGTTPGRSILRTKVTMSRHRKIRYSNGLERSLKVWWRGLGTGFPLASLITMTLAHGKLTRNGTTSWDTEGGFVVEHSRIGVPRATAAVVILAGFLFVTAIVSLSD